MDIDDWADLSLLSAIILHELRAHQPYPIPGSTRLSSVHDLITLGAIEACVYDGRISATATAHGWWLLSITQR